MTIHIKSWLLIFATFSLVMLIAIRLYQTRSLPFDSATWQAFPRDSYTGRRHRLSAVWAPRRRMVDDLIANHLQAGMSAADVCALLGPDINEHCGNFLIAPDGHRFSKTHSYWINDSWFDGSHVIGLIPHRWERGLLCFFELDETLRGCGVWKSD